METQLRELMRDLIGDPPHHITAQAVRHQMIRRRRRFAVIGTVVAIVAVLAAVIPALTGA
jgi:CHASE3 domain sensor protein